MDTKLKKKWVEALRSGKYKQARGKLYDGKGYCCLGVLACVMGKEVVYDEEKSTQSQVVGYRVVHAGILPSALGKKAGLDSYTQNTLAGMNDGLEQSKKSFKTIADYIEKNL